jgi:hypothetical protein
MDRKKTNREPAEIMRDEMILRDDILSLVADKAMTIPQIGQALGFPQREVTLWVMALWRYGRIVEKGDPDENGFSSYQAKEEE